MRLDDFESLFRSAVKPRFHRESVHLETIFHVSDLDKDGAELQALELQAFLQGLDDGDHGAIVTLCRSDWSSAADLAERVAALKPQMIVCQRHLGDADTDLAYTLGSVVDILSQACHVPVLLLPAPGYPLPPPARTMVVTDHLIGQDHLVSWGVHFTPDSGTLFLAHIEEQAAFDRYASALRRITGVDTQPTLDKLQAKLLSMPTDYVHAVQTALVAEGIQETVVPIVHMGDPIAEYSQLLAEHDIGLLICNARDPEQLAMEALGHALAVQLRHLPLLLV